MSAEETECGGSNGNGQLSTRCRGGALMISLLSALLLIAAISIMSFFSAIAGGFIASRMIAKQKSK